MNMKYYTDCINNSKKWRLDQLEDLNNPWDTVEPWAQSFIRYGYDPRCLIKILTS